MIPPITIIVASNTPRRRAREGSWLREFNSRSRTNSRAVCKSSIKSPLLGCGRASALRQVIHFHHANAGAAVLPSDDGSVISRQQTRGHGGLEWIGRREPAG